MNYDDARAEFLAQLPLLKPWPTRINTVLRAAHDAGWMLKDLAAPLNLSPRTVKRRIDSSRCFPAAPCTPIPPRPQDRRYRATPEEKAAAVAQVKAGKSVADVAESLNVHPTSIYTWIGETNVRPQSRIQPQEVVDAAVARRRAGESAASIAESIGSAPNTIQGWARDAGYGRNCGAKDHGQCGDRCCRRCGALNITWFTPTAIWNKVMGGNGGVLCVRCFVLAAEVAGVGVKGGWLVAPEYDGTGGWIREPDWAGRGDRDG